MCCCGASKWLVVFNSLPCPPVPNSDINICLSLADEPDEYVEDDVNGDDDENFHHFMCNFVLYPDWRLPPC